MIQPQALQRKLLPNAFFSGVKGIIILVMILYGSAVVSFAATISSFTPVSGPVGTLMSIRGANLSSAKTVVIGGVAAIIISNSSTKIVAMVMPGATTGTIGVTFATGTTSAKGDFTVTETPHPIAQQGRKLVDTAKTANWFLIMQGGRVIR